MTRGVRGRAVAGLVLLMPILLKAQIQTPSLNALILPLIPGAPGRWHALLRLRTRASLIMITVHPDGEDSGMLACESRSQGARAAMLTFNRGESADAPAATRKCLCPFQTL